MSQIVTYLNFDGQTREAMTFYANCLGGELSMMPFGSIPGGCAPDAVDRIMHARLAKDGAPLLMASDTPPGVAIRPGNNYFVSLHCDSREEVDRLFQALGEGGKVEMPLADMFWGGRFGTLTDRFGINWMFHYQFAEQPQTASA